MAEHLSRLLHRLVLERLVPRLANYRVDQLSAQLLHLPQALVGLEKVAARMVRGSMAESNRPLVVLPHLTVEKVEEEAESNRPLVVRNYHWDQFETLSFTPNLFKNSNMSFW